jgi:hypothetical protein
MQLESNAFVLSEIASRAALVRTTIDRLTGYLAQHFFGMPRHGETKHYALYPDLNMDLHGSGEPEESARYDKHAKELYAVIDDASAAYLEFRRVVKRTLLI